MKLKQMSTLHAAQLLIQAGEHDALVQLLELHPDLVHWQLSPDNHGVQGSLLHIVTGWEDKAWTESAKQIAQTLIGFGAEVNKKDHSNQGETALHLAVSINNVEVSQVLLENGADCELTGKYNIHIDTPLGYALFFGVDESLEKFRVNCPSILIRFGAKIYLPFAAALNEMNWVKRCFSSTGKLNPVAGPGHPQTLKTQALLFACRYGNLEVVDFLLYHGADINAVIPFFTHHASALHIACERGQQTELVQYLIKKGADPNQKDLKFNANPVGWAMFHGQDEVFKILHKQNWA